jgi:hypothetical protein
MMGAFRGSPKQIKPLAGDGFGWVNAIHGFAQMVRAGVVCRMGLYGKFPMVHCQKFKFHTAFLGCQRYSGT